MALQMLFSNWLVCGWLLSLLVGMGVAILQRPPDLPRPIALHWSFPLPNGGKWLNSWPRYAAVRGRLEEQRIQTGRSEQHGIVGDWRARDGWICRYV